MNANVKGTGGTLTGTAQYLREVSNGKIRIGLTDPEGAGRFYIEESSFPIVES